ncbi:hypothetical protein TFLX_01685 [Thermoflexales bacterium]|nr:hypothetical protein TFLX_01685 [Thermoflexales bacterium]
MFQKNWERSQYAYIIAHFLRLSRGNLQKSRCHS